jgi:parallel beta-helix repeat protein
MDNLVSGNGSDGIVLANSSGNTVVDNTITRNRVGITVRGDTTGSTILGNTVTDNEMASQGPSLLRDRAHGNGGQWLPRRIGLIWLSALALLGVLMGLTWAMQPRRGRIWFTAGAAR